VTARAGSPKLACMDTDSSDSKLFLVKRAAEIRGIYAPRLWRAIRSGQLPAYRVGSWLRVRLKEVDRWIDSQRFIPPGSESDGGEER